jgi:hypothetical protein
MYWPLGRIGDRSDMTDHWASESNRSGSSDTFFHVRAKGFIAFLTRLAHAAQDCRHAAGVCALHLALPR